MHLFIPGLDNMETKKYIQIPCAEDRMFVRQGIIHILQQVNEFKIVGEAADGEQTLELARILHPDILLCEIRLPKLSGIDVVRKLKELSSNTRVIVLSAYDNDEYITELMGAGAYGYLLKTIDREDLIHSIYKVSSGGIVLHPKIAAKIASLWAYGVLRDSVSGPLSERELDVLQLASRGLKSNDIAEQLSLSTRTVETHLHNIYSKLSVSSRAEAVDYFLTNHSMRMTRINPS